MNNDEEDKKLNKHTLADWFVPVYEVVLEPFSNGERIPVKYLYFPPGFWLVFVIIVLSLLKAIW